MDTRKVWQLLNDDGRADLARLAETTPGYLYLVMLGHKRPSAELAKRISEAAKKKGFEIPRSVLRPDLWEAA